MPLSAEADALRQAFKAEVAELDLRGDDRAASIWNRAVEHAVKLALIVTVATDHEAPETTAAQMDWAIRLARRSCRSLVREMQGKIADSAREANFNRVLTLIERAGKSGITVGKIADRTRGMDRRQRDEILHDLKLTGRAMGDFVMTGGRPTEVWKLAGA